MVPMYAEVRVEEIWKKFPGFKRLQEARLWCPIGVVDKSTLLKGIQGSQRHG